MQRISYFDFLRGVAIIMVCAIHCFGICYSKSNVSIPSIVVRNLMNIAVPLFFAISGYFLASKKMENGGYAKFLKRQVPRVYVPVLFCSLVYLFQDIVNGVYVEAIVSFFFCGYSIYYFISVIIQCYLLLPVFNRNLTVSCILTLFVISVAWWALNIYFVGMFLKMSLPLEIYAGNFIPWSVFFVLGMSFSKYGGLCDCVTLKSLFFFAAILCVLSVVESIYIIDSRGTLNGVGQKPSSVCLNFVLCIIALHGNTRRFFSLCKKNVFYDFICLLGRFSFGIYLIHFFTLKMAWKIESFLLCPSIKWIVCTMLVLPVSMVPLMVWKKIFPRMSKILLGV